MQRFVEGDDYRIVVLDQEVIASYRRLPLSVEGDGVHSIIQLLQIKQERFRQMDRDTVIKTNDPKIKRKLMRSGLNFDVIPAPDKVLPLLDNANLSAGGDAIDVTDVMHPSYKETAISYLVIWAYVIAALTSLRPHQLKTQLASILLSKLMLRPDLIIMWRWEISNEGRLERCIKRS